MITIIVTIISVISIPRIVIASNFHANSILSHIPKTLRGAMAFYLMDGKVRMTVSKSKTTVPVTENLVIYKIDVYYRASSNI